MELFVDGGCSGNSQRDITRRRMRAAVVTTRGVIVAECIRDGGSNNIAELLAVYEALAWCRACGIKAVTLYTDSRNNFAWVFGSRLGKRLADRAAVSDLQAEITALRADVELRLQWVPRDDNRAGHYLEKTYGV